VPFALQPLPAREGGSNWSTTMIPSPQAGADARRLLDELGQRLNRDERDALAEVAEAADRRYTVGPDVAELVGRAMRKRDAQSWMQ
jgi:hypothetical protein